MINKKRIVGKIWISNSSEYSYFCRWFSLVLHFPISLKSNEIKVGIFIDIKIPVGLTLVLILVLLVVLILAVGHKGVFVLLWRSGGFLERFGCEGRNYSLRFVRGVFLVWFYWRLRLFIVFVVLLILIVVIQVIEVVVFLIRPLLSLHLCARWGLKVFAFLLYFLQLGFDLSESLKYFVDEFEDLLVFKFGIQKVKVVFCFNIVQNIVPIHVWLS